MTTQFDKGTLFRSLHQRERAFILPNPWDPGTARLLAGLGFEALATTSAGFAFSHGKLDGAMDRDTVMAHAAEIVAATGLPVSADLENGFGTRPETVAETIRLSAAQGLVGGSIEDASRDESSPILPIELAKERIEAAAEAARALHYPFTLTARAENYLYGKPDLDDTVRRLQAFQEAGADVLYAPGLVSADDIETVVRSVDRPVNVLCGMPGMRLDVDQLSQIGVKRISTGSALARSALGAFLMSAREIATRGTFGFVEEAIANSRDVAPLLKSWVNLAGEKR